MAILRPSISFVRTHWGRAWGSPERMPYAPMSTVLHYCLNCCDCDPDIARFAGTKLTLRNLTVW
jgi:hypothetical protein